MDSSRRATHTDFFILFFNKIFTCFLHHFPKECTHMNYNLYLLRLCSAVMHKKRSLQH